MIQALPIVTVLLAAYFIYYLLTAQPPQLTRRLPGADNAPPKTTNQPVAKIAGTLKTFDTQPADIPGSFPQFRGPNRDGVISDPKTRLLYQWPDNGPEILWQIPVGEGYAGASIHNGKVYIIDYDRENQRDFIRCLSLETGRDIWQFSYPVSVKRNHGMSRTIPAVSDEFVVTIGPKCHVTCLDSATGKFLWMIDLEREYGTTVPPWYAGQCPLIDNRTAIIAPAGPEFLVIAVDCATGEIIWRSPNLRSWKMTHSSVMPAEFFGRKMYIYCATGGVTAINAQDGSVIWDSNTWKIRIANVPTPVIIDNNQIFFSGGYNTGSMMMQLTQENQQIIPQVIYTLPPDTFGSAQQTPIYYQGHIYGVRPDEQFVCLDLTGRILWTSTTAQKFGLGPYLIVNDIIYILDDNGRITMARAQPTSFEMLGQVQILTGHDAWAPLAYAAGRIIIRDLNTMTCLKIADISQP